MNIFNSCAVLLVEHCCGFNLFGSFFSKKNSDIPGHLAIKTQRLSRHIHVTDRYIPGHLAIKSLGTYTLQTAKESQQAYYISIDNSR